MPMTFDETGHGELAAQLDDFGVGPDVRLDFRFGPNCNDSIARHGHGFHDRLTPIHRHNLTTHEHKVGRWNLSGRDGDQKGR